MRVNGSSNVKWPQRSHTLKPRMHVKLIQIGQLPLPRPRPLQQTDEQLLIGLKCDLALLTVMAKGNDYLPALRGLVLESGVREAAGGCGCGARGVEE